MSRSVSNILFRDPRVSYVLAAVLLAAIFWFDVVSPGGLTAPMLYVIPTILFASGSRFAEPLAKRIVGMT